MGCGPHTAARRLGRCRGWRCPPLRSPAARPAERERHLRGRQHPIQVTGLASGLDTAKIVSQMMDIQKRPVTILQNQQKSLEARNTQLTSIQAALKKVNADALALLDPRVYRGTQKATSSDTTRVAATTTSGAGVGGYQISVGQLANAAQRTFSFTAPASAGTITIDGHDTSVAAGASVYDVADAINNDQSATVYAAATDAGTLVFSNRNTGDTGPGFIAITGADGVLSEQAAHAKQGQNATYCDRRSPRILELQRRRRGHPRRDAHPHGGHDDVRAGHRQRGRPRRGLLQGGVRDQPVHHRLQLGDLDDPDAALPEAHRQRSDAGHPLRRQSAQGPARLHALADDQGPATASPRGWRPCSTSASAPAPPAAAVPPPRSSPATSRSTRARWRRR